MRDLQKVARHGEIVRRQHQIVLEEERVGPKSIGKEVSFRTLVVQCNSEVMISCDHLPPWNDRGEQLDAGTDVLLRSLDPAAAKVCRAILKQHDLVAWGDLRA
jgi:hypothetical protein